MRYQSRHPDGIRIEIIYKKPVPSRPYLHIHEEAHVRIETTPCNKILLLRCLVG